MTGSAPIIPLTNPVRTYAWGSHTAIAALQGRAAPTAEPEAELWIGAHPSAPSRRATDGAALHDLVAAAPRELLGPAVAGRYGPRLPFLLKVLAADEPLSLQVHPSAELAERGFAAEEAAGVAIEAPQRVYRDAWPKPELLCALTPFAAMCGFRPAAATARLLEDLDVAALAPVAAKLRAEGDAALPAVVRDLLAMAAKRRSAAVAAVRRTAGAHGRGGGPFAAQARWLADLAQRYPGDGGVLVCLLLHLVELEPGAALAVAPGVPHVYLRGTAIEVMATSDNVMRGGLTRKHVDVESLLEALDATAGPPPVVTPRTEGDHEAVYPASSPYFRLSRLTVDADPVELTRRGGQVLLCTEGTLSLAAGAEEVRLGAGEAAFVAAAAEPVAVRGPATAYRATSGLD